MIRREISDYSRIFKTGLGITPWQDILDNTILIVDDSAENIFSLKTLLELHKFKVDSAVSGEEALRKVLKNPYALIILDVQMPGMDGFEVAEALAGSSKAKEIPVIFLSAVSTHKKFITKGYSSGGIDYVTKPFDPEILLLKVKTFIRLYEQNRELTAIQNTLREEIERKTLAESGLKQSVDELRSILQSIPQLAFTTRGDGAVEFVNNQWFDYAADKDHFPETKEGCLTVPECLRFALEAAQPQVLETCIRKLNSTEFEYFLLGLTPVRKEDTIVKWVGIFTDINEQKIAEQTLERKVGERTVALQEMNKELETSNNELQQFAFVASHDLQEPLRKIQVFSTILKDKYIKDDQEAVTYIDRVISSSERMRALINDLLGFSRLSSDDLFVDVNLKDLVETILVDLDVLIKSKNAVIRLSTLPVLEGIPTQLSQVFQNLITNALKFAKDDVSPVIEIKGERVDDRLPDAQPSSSGKFCRITIIDNGIGFNQQYAEKIFTIFQRLSSQKKYEGTGIGLAIVRKVVDKHKGLITATSEDDKGATFTIILPLRQSSAS